MSPVSNVHSQQDIARDEEKTLRETAERLHLIQRRENSEEVREARRKEERVEEALVAEAARHEKQNRAKKDRVEISMPEPAHRQRNLEPRQASMPNYFLIYKIAPGFREVTVSYEENFHGQFLQSRA